MTSLMILRLVCSVVVCAFTGVGVALFARACLVIIARMRLGRPAEDRSQRPWRRTARMLGEILSHRSFRARVWIAVAHWLVMVSFPLLALTLVTGYGQVLGGPGFSLPWLDHQAWWSWIVEVIAWLSLAGIVGLILVRRRLTAGGRAKPPFDSTSEGGTRTRSPRFSGSSAAQAVFVEAVVLIVVTCVLALRMLEATQLHLTEPHSPLGSWSHYPLTSWAVPLLSPLGVTGVEAAILVVATIKVVVSMSWMVVIGLQPSMGVAWHRFLAVVNVWARREVSAAPTTSTQQDRPAVGSKALGPAKELVFDNAQGH
ncbi:Fe-S oxidoreductase, partial [Actinomyces urogenitalis]